jgi:glutaredoxin
MASLLALTLALASVSPALATAQKHLQEGKLDELAFDLADGVHLLPGEIQLAASVLARGAAEAEQKSDSVLAFQLAQTAHRRDARQPEALRVLADLSLADRAFSEADAFGDALAAVAPSDPRVALLRARIACAEEDWGPAAQLSGPLELDGSLTATERAEATLIHARATTLAPRPSSSLEATSAEEAQIHAAAEIAAREREQSLAPPAASEAPIVMYSTTWCGYCKKARAYFAEHHLAFVDKDIEKDPAAAEEMREKGRQAHMNLSGVPIIDVRGTMIQGFNPGRIEQALKQGPL